MSNIRFYTLENTGVLRPAPHDALRQDYIEAYYKKLVGSRHKAESKDGHVVFTIRSYRKGRMSVLVESLSTRWGINYESGLSLFRDYLTAMVDDLLFAKTKQYFGVYAAPKCKILYHRHVTFNYPCVL